jgi:hypothetical protein
MLCVNQLATALEQELVDIVHESPFHFLTAGPRIKIRAVQCAVVLCSRAFIDVARISLIFAATSSNASDKTLPSLFDSGPMASVRNNCKLKQRQHDTPSNPPCPPGPMLVLAGRQPGKVVDKVNVALQSISSCRASTTSPHGMNVFQHQESGASLPRTSGAKAWTTSPMDFPPNLRYKLAITMASNGSPFPEAYRPPLATTEAK